MDKKKNHNAKKDECFSPLGFVLGLLFVVSVVFAFFSFFKRGKGIETEKRVKEKGRPSKKNLENKLGDVNLNPRQNEILSLLRENGTITTEQIMKKIKGVSERTLRRDFSRLEELGYSKKLGSTKGSRYILVD